MNPEWTYTEPMIKAFGIFFSLWALWPALESIRYNINIERASEEIAEARYEVFFAAFKRAVEPSFGIEFTGARASAPRFIREWFRERRSHFLMQFCTLLASGTLVTFFIDLYLYLLRLPGDEAEMKRIRKEYPLIDPSPQIIFGDASTWVMANLPSFFIWSGTLVLLFLYSAKFQDLAWGPIASLTGGHHPDSLIELQGIENANLRSPYWPVVTLWLGVIECSQAYDLVPTRRRSPIKGGAGISMRDAERALWGIYANVPRKLPRHRKNAIKHHIEHVAGALREAEMEQDRNLSDAQIKMGRLLIKIAERYSQGRLCALLDESDMTGVKPVKRRNLLHFSIVSVFSLTCITAATYLNAPAPVINLLVPIVTIVSIALVNRGSTPGPAQLVDTINSR
ncbi:hypothetical protein ABZ488_29585 [Streptomyces griseus]|uniref:hypothetical protein n=1 Tax=Streptomyces griseus TaxID=1911 RepID=UPI0033C347CC